jgi:hypothetical protein
MSMLYTLRPQVSIINAPAIITIGDTRTIKCKNKNITQRVKSVCREDVHI